EITELCGSRDVVDVVLRHRELDRCVQGVAKLVADCGVTRRFGLLENSGNFCSVLESAQREEIVPIRMHRLCGVTLMTDRLREETIKDVLVTLQIFRSHATAAQ